MIRWTRRLFSRSLTSCRVPSIPRIRRMRPQLMALEARDVPATIMVTSNGDAVANDGFVTLREALNSINGGANTSDVVADISMSGYGTNDAITFGVTGTITLTGGELLASKSVMVTGPGSGQLTLQQTTVGARVLRIDNAVAGQDTFSLSGLTLTGGNRTGAAAADRGGAIGISSESVTLTDCVLTGNVVEAGGGALSALSTTATSISLINCQLTNNTVTGSGLDGGAFRGTTFTTLSMTNCLVSGNVAADDGGALYIVGGAASTFINTSFINNRAGGFSNTDATGGAMMIAGTFTGPITFTNCTISGNSTIQNGGGVRFSPLFTGTADFNYCTITGNTAKVNGGGIARDAQTSASATLNLVGTVVANNSAAVYPDVFVLSPGVLNVTNSVIGTREGYVLNSGSLAVPAGTPIVLGIPTNNGGTLPTVRAIPGSPLINAGGIPGAPLTDQIGNPRIDGAAADIGALEVVSAGPLAPVAVLAGQLSGVAKPGGTSYSFSLTYYDDGLVKRSSIDATDIVVTGKAGASVSVTKVSSAVDAPSITVEYTITPPGGSWDISDNATYTISLANNAVEDTLGNKIGSGTVGSVVVAVGNIYTVTNDDGGTALAGSFGKAVADAMAANPASGFVDLITFDPVFFATPRTISLSAVVNITDGVYIEGPGKDLLTVRPATVNRIFFISDGINGTARNVTLTGMTMRDGVGPGAGGAIRMISEFVTLQNVRLTGNQAPNIGGAIGVDTGIGSQLIVIDSELTSNLTTGSGNSGGAIGTLATTDTFVHVKNSRISGNTAAGGGGAIVTNISSLLIEDSLIFGNAQNVSSGTVGGGGIFITSPAASVDGPRVVVIRNSTLTNNTAVSAVGTSAGGGGIFVDLNSVGSVMIANSTISNNSSGAKGGGISRAGGSFVFQVTNSIIDGNTAPSGPDLIGPGNIDFYNSLLSDATGASYSDFGGNVIGSSAKLTALYGFGGLWPTQATLPGSPAREAGVASDRKFDQRGVGFPRVVGSPDMGALEFALGTPIATATTVSTMTFAPITTTASNYTFTITYHDEAGILASTVNGDEIRVKSNKTGYDQFAKVMATSGPLTDYVVTYQILPSDMVAWGFADNGDYTISLEGGNVTDTGSAPVPATTFGTFNVGIPLNAVVNSTADSGPGSLRRVLTDVNASGTSATVTFDPTVFASPQTITLTSGEILVSENVTITGPGVNQLTVSGNRSSRIFNVFNSDKAITVNMSGMVLRDGRTYITGIGGSGGAILNNGETVNLSNMQLLENGSFARGGAIAVQAGNLSLTDVVGAGNRADNRGSDGGFLYVAISGNVTLLRSSITGNYAFDGGGGFYMAGTSSLSLDRCTVSGNIADADASSFGGGMYLGSGTSLFAVNTTISNNSSGRSGGGIRFNTTSVTLESCTIAGNIARKLNTGAGGGGGIYRAPAGTGLLTLNNTVVTENVALNGGIGNDINVNSGLVDCIGAAVFDPSGWNPNGTLAIAQGTPMLLGPLTNNGGGFLTHLPAPGSPLRDAGPLTGPPSVDQRGVARPLGAGLDIGAVESLNTEPVGIVTPLVDVIAAGGADYQVTVTYYDDVGITKLGDDDIRVVGPNSFNALAKLTAQTPVAGGVEATYTLNAPGSTWDNTDAGVYSVTLEAGSVEDSSGKAVAAATLGQFRVQLARNYVVTNTNNSGPGSLRQAILDSNQIQGTDSPIDTITFDPGVFGSATTITLNTEQLLITDSLKIVGPGVGKLNIVAGSPIRHFFMENLTIDVEITDMTLSGGKLTGIGTENDAGGSVLIVNDKVTFRRVNFLNNTTNTAVVGGGAMMVLNNGANVLLENTIFQGNSARSGGAIRLSSSDAPGIVVEIHNAQFLNNSVTNEAGAISVEDAKISIYDTTFVGNGGGIGNGGALLLITARVNALIESCLFENNTAPNGGAIRLSAAGVTAEVRNSTFSGNTATTGGGGAISNNGGILTIYNSTLAFNSAGGGTGGGGLRHIAGTATLESTIVSNNTATSGVGPDVSGAVTITANNSIIANPANSNATGTNLFNVDPLLGPLANNGGQSKTHALMPGSKAIDNGTNFLGLFYDQRGVGFPRDYPLGVPDIGAYEVQPAPPHVVSVLVNGAMDIQRSMVTSLTVTFSEMVSFPSGLANAFTLERYGKGSSATVGLTFSPPTGPASDVTISFNASMMPLDPLGSLQDGQYRLTINAANVMGSLGTLDGNGNNVSEGSPTDDYTTQFHRLFGDGNGDGSVTASDFNAFRLVYGSPGPSFFDYDGGGVSASDFNAFRLRYGASGYLP